MELVISSSSGSGA